KARDLARARKKAAAAPSAWPRQFANVRRGTGQRVGKSPDRAKLARPRAWDVGTGRQRLVCRPRRWLAKRQALEVAVRARTIGRVEALANEPRAEWRRPSHLHAPADWPAHRPAFAGIRG